MGVKVLVAVYIIYMYMGVWVSSIVDVGRRKIKVGVLEGVTDGVWVGDGVIKGVGVSLDV